MIEIVFGLFLVLCIIVACGAVVQLMLSSWVLSLADTSKKAAYWRVFILIASVYIVSIFIVLEVITICYLLDKSEALF